MYAGPIGWFGGEEAEFAVGIRSALVKKVSYGFLPWALMIKSYELEAEIRKFVCHY